MIRLAIAALAVAGLTGCSREAAPPDQGASAGAAASSQAAVEAPAAPGANAAQGGAAGGDLTGSVSGLTGEISGFETEVTDTATIVRLAADVLFEFDKAELAPSAEEQLRRTADLIREGGSGDIAVVGHTDAKGDDAYNEDLSRRRAQAVAAWLAAQGGVDAGRLKPTGMGEREPVAPNATGSGDDPAGRARNRRVVVVVPRAGR